MRSVGLLAGIAVTVVLAFGCSDGSTTDLVNAPPVADFDLPSCTAGTACTFVSKSSDDVEVTGWIWDFNGDDTPDATTATASYTYGSAGDFSVSLTVQDAQGQDHTKTSTITVAAAEPPPPPPPANPAPTADFTYSCAQAVCTFVSTSTDAAPGTIASAAWAFGDGSTGEGNNPSHTYTVAAITEFTVTLTVSDNQGATDVETKTIVVDPAPPANQPPTARFTLSCIGAVCTFVSTSFDHGGRIEAQAWTFGDGGTSTEVSPSHTYNVTTATEFTVTLTVTDNEGATAVTSQTFTLDPNAANVPPTASFVAWCYGDGCKFTSTSTDATPGKIVSYAWSFGDGATSEWPNWTFSQHFETHVYSISARTQFAVTLTVTDNEGATAVATHTITLTPLPPAVQGCTTSGKILECVLDIPTRSTLRLTLNGVSCDLVQKISAPPPAGDQMFLSVCNRKAGDATGIFGGALDELWVYEAGGQARIWFTQGNSTRPLNPPEGRGGGAWPDWTISIEDGDHPGAPGEPDFTDIVLGVRATAR